MKSEAAAKKRTREDWRGGKKVDRCDKTKT